MITYKEIFPLLKDNKMWLGANNPAPKEFMRPDGTMQKFGNIGWFTNLDLKKRHEDLILVKRYTPEAYPHYDNYDAIEVSKVADIPCDYAGVMGVPVTFLDKYSKSQFEIIGISGDLANPLLIDGKRKTGRFYINGRRLYDRIAIRNRHPEAPKEV